MDNFAAKQGVPNAYGLIQGEANSIAAAQVIHVDPGSGERMGAADPRRGGTAVGN